MELTEEIIADLKSKHGADLVAVEVGGQTLVFRKPTGGEWDRHVDTIRADPKELSKSTRVLTNNCCVWPSLAAWEAAVAKEPAAPINSMMAAINELVGGDGKPRKL